MQTSLYTLQNRKDYLLAHLARCSPGEKVQFTMGSALSGPRSKAERGSFSTDLLKVLKENFKTGFVNIITDDES
jgi:hypothetical protein